MLSIPMRQRRHTQKKERSKVLHCGKAHKIDKRQGHIYDANISISRMDRWLLVNNNTRYIVELEHGEAQQ